MAMEKVKELVWEPSISKYGADEGLPELRDALVKKVFSKSLVLFHSGCHVLVWRWALVEHANLILFQQQL